MTHYPYVIVGGGMTADAAARALRETDPAGGGLSDLRRTAPAVCPPAVVQGPVERRTRIGHLARHRIHRSGAPAVPAYHGDRHATTHRDRRTRGGRDVRQAAPRHGRHATAPAARVGADHLFPYLRRLPPSPRSGRTSGCASPCWAAGSSARRSRRRCGWRAVMSSCWCRKTASAHGCSRRTCRTRWSITTASRAWRCARAKGSRA